MKKVLIILLIVFTLINNASAAYIPDSPHQPLIAPEFIPVIEDIWMAYDLTIYYIDMRGNPVAPNYFETLITGTQYNIISPIIENYISTTTIVKGIMPKRDVKITVIYMPNSIEEKLILIDNYETPLGIGPSIMNVGVCIE